jgi:hypothetical protein
MSRSDIAVRGACLRMRHIVSILRFVLACHANDVAAPDELLTG